MRKFSIPSTLLAEIVEIG